MTAMAGYPRTVRGLDRRRWTIAITATVPGVDHPECVPGWRTELIDPVAGRVVRDRVDLEEVGARLAAKAFATALRRPSSPKVTGPVVPADVAALLDGVDRPQPPPKLAAGTGAIVASCPSGDAAALAVIWHEEAVDGGGYTVGVHSYRRLDGRWFTSGGCWSSWPVVYGERPPAQQWVTGIASGPTGEERTGFTVGIAPPGASEVDVARDDGSTVPAPVEPVTGVVLVARR